MSATQNLRVGSPDHVTALPAAVRGPGAGDARWWFGQLALIKAGAPETHGRYTLVEIVAPANYATPLHVHAREDEAFWILDGEAVFDVGGEMLDASVGSYLLAPRGVAHRFTAGASGARILFLFTPGGFERYIQATSVAARQPIIPPADVTPPENVAEIARAFGTEIFGDESRESEAVPS
jgi:mannose-6-phosphate isomerase-like protein (cupin superfamily)